MKQLLQWKGLSRQAVHQGLQRQQRLQLQCLQTLELADQIREDHPSMSCRDIYYAVAGLMPRGRDWSEQMLLANGYRIKYPPRSFTMAGADICSNLIEGMSITAPNQVWQTDLTYVWVNKRWYYVSFILDVYSRKILSWHCSRDLSSHSQIECVSKALLALSATDRRKLIVHTDRGVQYTSSEYKRFLAARRVKQSMARYAWQNAYCERLHRTIKSNYLSYYRMGNYQDLIAGVRKAVKVYNRSKPHRNLPGRLSPEKFIQAHKEGRYADYTVKVWSKLTSTKMLNVN